MNKKIVSKGPAPKLVKGGIFGWPLDKVFSKVKSFVNDCLSFLEKYGLKEKGVFRVCGSDSKIKAYRRAVDQGKMKWKEGLDIHNIASLLKLYFRELPEPLLTFDLYDAFIAAAVSPPETREKEIASVINLLPSMNKEIFSRLILFLHNVSQHSKENLMDPNNLAIVWAPTVLRPRVETVEVILGDAAHSNQLLSTIISNALFFFPPPTPSTASKATKATAEEAKKLIEERYHAAINPQESEVITSTLRKRYQDHRQKSFIAFKRMKDRIQRQAHLSEEKFAEHIEKLTQKIKEGDYVPVDMEAAQASGQEANPTPTTSGPSPSTSSTPTTNISPSVPSLSITSSSSSSRNSESRPQTADPSSHLAPPSLAVQSSTETTSTTRPTLERKISFQVGISKHLRLSSQPVSVSSVPSTSHQRVQSLSVNVKGVDSQKQTQPNPPQPRPRSKSQSSRETEQNTKNDNKVEMKKERKEKRSKTPREERPKNTETQQHQAKKTFSTSKSVGNTSTQSSSINNKSQQDESLTTIQASGDSEQESSSESGTDPDIFDESKFDKHIEEQNRESKDNLGDWSLIQMIMGKINPRAMPIDPEDAIQSEMLNMVISEESTK